MIMMKHGLYLKAGNSLGERFLDFLLVKDIFEFFTKSGKQRVSTPFLYGLSKCRFILVLQQKSVMNAIRELQKHTGLKCTNF